MKNILFTILTSLCLIGFKSNAQTTNCSKFKNGTFIIADGQRVDTIVRFKNFQIETNNQDTIRATFNVKWIDGCSYTLTPAGNTFKDRADIPKGAMLTVKFIKIEGDICTQRLSSNYTDLVMTCDIKKIK